MMQNHTVNYCVLTGSVIGPLRFLTYADDYEKKLALNSIMYTYDTKSFWKIVFQTQFSLYLK